MGGIGGYNDGQNYFGIMSITSMANTPVNGSSEYTTGNTSISVIQAYNIDSKIDDGFPLSGTVQAIYEVGADMFFAKGGGGAANNQNVTPGGIASASAITCIDNGGNAANTFKYSTQYNSGNGTNCALSFKFQ